MALLKPFSYTLTQGWGPTTRLDEPAGYAELGRFWWNPVSIAGFVFYQHFHPGLDLAAAEGTPILASETGLVIQAGLNPASPVSGIRLEVQIRPGTSYGHGHLSALGPGIHVGARVARGQVIAYVGHTGGATGPHSHFFVQSIVPATHQAMIYDPGLFFPGGANANDPRIAPLAAPVPPPSTPIGVVNFVAGTYVGHQFNSSGAIVSSKPYTLASASSAPTSKRSTIINQSGYWYYITAGVWTGYWIADGIGVTFTPNSSQPAPTYPRNLSFAAGTYTGRQFNSSGVIVASKSYTLTKASSAPTSQRSQIVGQPGYWYFITAGVWMNFWIPDGAGIS